MVPTGIVMASGQKPVQEATKRRVRNTGSVYVNDVGGYKCRFVYTIPSLSSMVRVSATVGAGQKRVLVVYYYLSNRRGKPSSSLTKGSFFCRGIGAQYSKSCKLNLLYFSHNGRTEFAETPDGRRVGYEGQPDSCSEATPMARGGQVASHRKWDTPERHDTTAD